MNKTAIACKGIKKSYGKDLLRVEALRGIDMQVDTSELTLLVGPSGSGKTTLLSIISAILTPDEGVLEIFGTNPHALEDIARSQFCSQTIGIVFQSLHLIPTLTNEENVAMPLLVAKESRRSAHKKAKEMLEKLAMGFCAERSPSDLSKGQQQRVAIARALIHDPSVIICDEPTSALDQEAGTKVMTLLQQLASDTNRAVLVVTHDHRIFHFANKIITINDGRIVPADPNVTVQTPNPIEWLAR